MWILWKPGKILTLVLKIVDSSIKKRKKIYQVKIQKKIDIQSTKHETEPCDFFSSTFRESIDLMRSTISANLSGDSGFQSTCTDSSLEKSIE